MAKIGTGQEMLHIPFGEMIANIAIGIADAQHRLDQSSMNVAEMMSGQRVLRSMETGEPILKADGTKSLIDSRVYFGHIHQDRGFNAQATPIINDSVGELKEIKIINAGEKHTDDKTYTIDISGGGGSGAKATPQIGENGDIKSIIIENPGQGYISPPKIKIGGLGRGKQSDAILEAIIIPKGGIQSINLTNSGTGYDVPPQINIIGEGVGASASAEIDTNTQQIKSIKINTPGGGYRAESTRIEIIAQKKLVPQKLSMIELGFTPNFYHFVDTVINLKVALKISKTGKDYQVHSAPVDASYVSSYNYNLEAAASIQTKIVAIPPPTILEERIRQIQFNQEITTEEK